MSLSRGAIGIVLLLVVALLWVSSSFLIQYIFGEVHYDKPLFLTYISTSFFSIYLLPTACNRICFRRNSFVSPSADDNFSSEQVTKVYALNILQFGVLWLVANYLFNLALDRTSVASNSILSTLSNVFTLFLAAYLRIEKLSLLKFVYVLLNFVGVVSVTWSDSSSRGSRTLVGDTFSILSALFYSFYVLFLQAKLMKSSPLDISEVFGWMGLLMMIILLPVVFLWSLLDFEKFAVPSLKSFLFLIMNALIGTVLSDYLWALAVVYTSPVLATMALSLTIPLSTLLDTLRGKTHFSSLYFFGACCVFSGFIGLAWENRKEELSRENVNSMS